MTTPLEHIIGVNRACVTLITGVLCWTIIALKCIAAVTLFGYVASAYVLKEILL